jgi:tetratricopeptide (TPR) repeat protein
MKGQRPAPAPATATAPKKFITPQDVCLGALLFVATLIAYWPALNGGMVWDDDGHVTPVALRSLHGLGRIWLELGATQQYYPLLHSAFWVEHRLWGDAVLGYHLTNVLLHATAACLVVAVVRRLALPGAWLAGFIFALHPVCVEAVAWISEQKSTLSAVFYLSAALVYLRFDQTRKQAHYFWALGFFVLALLSKTVTATLPAALLVIFWWKRGKLDWKRDVQPLLPWLVLGVIAGLFTAGVERNYIGAKGAAFNLTLLERLLLAGRVIWFYLGKLLWPANLMFTYPHWRIDPSAGWQYLFPLGVVALTGGLLFAARRRRGPLAAFLFFAGTLFPVMGFFNVFPFKYSYVADHFQYLASLGIIVPFAAGLTRSADRPGAAPRRLVYGLCVILPLAAAALTFRQSGMYRDSVTLYRETLARNPSSWMAHNNLAVILAKMPEHVPEAVTEYEAALKIKTDEAALRTDSGADPDVADLHNNLGSALMKIPSRSAEAIAEFRESLRLNPDNAKVHVNLGVILMKTPGRLPEAKAEFETGLRLDPNDADAHSDLGNVLIKTPGQLSEAMAEIQTALRLNPDLAAAHYSLGNALATMGGRLPEEIQEYQTALLIDPDYAEAHYSLGSALMKVPGRMPEAIAELEAAVRINPDFAEAENNLGCALVGTPGRTSDALTHFQAAIRIKPDYAEAHKNLGLALTNIPGRSSEAIAQLQAVVQITPNDAEAHYNLGNVLMGDAGQLPEAMTEYEAALRINPDFAEAHHNLGCALASTPGRMADAITHFQAAVQIKPGYAEAHKNLGLALSTMPGRFQDAIAELEAALRIDPNLESAQQALKQLQGTK